MNMGERIRDLRRKRRISQKDFAAYIHVSPSTVSMYESNDREPYGDTLVRMARLLEVSTDYLLEGKTDEAPLVPGALPSGPTVNVPVYGAIRAGEPMMVMEEVRDYETVDVDDYQRGDFYLEVQGDSMEPDHIPAGARVLVRPQPEVQPSEIAVVIVDSENATLARVQFANDQAVIMKSNPRYPPQLYPASEVRIVGRVVAWKIKPEYLKGG